MIGFLFVGIFIGVNLSIIVYNILKIMKLNDEIKRIDSMRETLMLALGRENK